MRADNEDVDLTTPARLPPRRQRLEFAFTALSFVAPERIRYRYRLEGFDRDWVDAGAGHQAIYTRLPPGSYRFRVVAANADGAWNESGAVYAFELAPSFYETALVLAAGRAGGGAGRGRPARLAHPAAAPARGDAAGAHPGGASRRSRC